VAQQLGRLSLAAFKARDALSRSVGLSRCICRASQPLGDGSLHYLVSVGGFVPIVAKPRIEPLVSRRDFERERPLLLDGRHGRALVDAAHDPLLSRRVDPIGERGETFVKASPEIDAAGARSRARELTKQHLLLICLK
jgi:hypothetical protein